MCALRTGAAGRSPDAPPPVMGTVSNLIAPPPALHVVVVGWVERMRDPPQPGGALVGLAGARPTLRKPPPSLIPGPAEGVRLPVGPASRRSGQRPARRRSHPTASTGP